MSSDATTTTYNPYGQYNPNYSDEQTAENKAYGGNQDFLNNLANSELGQVSSYGAPQIGNTDLGSAPTATAAQGTAAVGNAALVGPAAQAQGAQVSQSGAQSQQALLAQLGQQAQGQGPSTANLQLQTALSQAANQQQGQAALFGGRNSSASQRAAMVNTAALAQNAANQSVQNRVNDQLSAQSQLANVAGTVQGQNLSAAQLAQANSQYNATNTNAFTLANQGATNAQTLANETALNTQGAQNVAAAQQTALANAAAAGQYGLQQGTMDQAAATTNATNTLQNEVNNTQRQVSFDTLAGQTSQQAAANLQGQQTLDASDYNATMGANAGIYQNAVNANAGTVNAVIGAGSTVGAAAAKSDERAKDDIEDAGDEIDALLSQLKASSYRYKDGQGEAPGRHVGVMAQDLLKTDAGRGMVKQDSTGTLQVDYGQGLGTMMAALADIHGRLKKLED